MSGITLFNI